MEEIIDRLTNLKAILELLRKKKYRDNYRLRLSNKTANLPLNGYYYYN